MWHLQRQEGDERPLSTFGYNSCCDRLVLVHTLPRLSASVIWSLETRIHSLAARCQLVLAAALKEILRCCDHPLATRRRLQNDSLHCAVTRCVAEVTRFGAAVVQRLRRRTCSARADRVDLIPDSRKSARTRRAGASRLSRRATKIGPSRHGASTSGNRFLGRPSRVLVRTVGHLQSIAFSAAKALTLIGISARLPGGTGPSGPWAGPIPRGTVIATAAHDARIRPSGPMPTSSNPPC